MRRQKKIAIYLEKYPNATERDLQQKFGMSFREAQGFLHTEVESGADVSFVARIKQWFVSEWRTIGTLAGLAFVVRAVYLWFLFREPLLLTPIHDAAYYLAWAKEIVETGWLGQKVFFTEPLYAYVLALFLKLFGNEGWRSLIVFQGILGIFFPVTLYFLGKRLLNPGVGVVAGLLAAIYGPLVFYDGLLLKTSLEVYLLPIFLLVVFRVFDRPTWKGFGLLGMSLGLLVLIKGNNLIFLPVLIALIWWLFRTQTWKAPFFWSLMLTSGVLLLLAPVTIRNYLVGHDFVPTNYSIGLVMYQGSWWGGDGSTANVPRFLRPDPKYEEHDAVGMAEAYTGRELLPSEVSRFWMKKTVEEIVAHPGHFIGTVWNKLLLIVNQSEFSDNYSYTFYRTQIPFLWLLPTYSLLIIFALFGIGLFTRMSFWQTIVGEEEERIHQKRTLFLTLLGAYVMVLLLTTVNARYRMPLLPFFFVAASSTLVFLVSRWAERDSRLLTRSAILLLPILFLVWFPLASLKHVTTDANAYHALGYEALVRQEYLLAKELFQKTIEIDPRYGWAYGNLTLVALAEGNLSDAKKNLQQLILLRPDDISNYERLKLIRSLEGATPEMMRAAADKYLREADTPVYDANFNEAQRFLSSGETDQAERLLERSIEQPGDRSASLISLASLKKQKKETAKAREYLKRIVAEHPENFTARYNLANVYIEERNYGEVVRQLKDVYDFVPELGETWYNYIVALTKTGQSNLAATVAQAYVDRFEGDPTKQEKVDKFKAALKPANNDIQSLIKENQAVNP